jgi:hypothetical protein
VTALERMGALAARENPIWASALRASPDRRERFRGACPDRYLLGVEMIYEGYLLHYGRSRLFSQEDPDLALLTGDYLYAAGLSQICDTGDLAAVAALAGLIARLARDRGDGNGAAHEALWEETVRALGPVAEPAAPAPDPGGRLARSRSAN